MCLEYTCFSVVEARNIVAVEGAVRIRKQGPYALLAQWIRAVGFYPTCREFESLKGCQSEEKG